MSVAEKDDAQVIKHAQIILLFLRDGKGVRVDQELAVTLERLIRMASRPVATTEGS